MFDFASLGDWGIYIGPGGVYGTSGGTGNGSPTVPPPIYTAGFPGTSSMNAQTQQMLFIGLIVVAVILLTKR